MKQVRVVDRTIRSLKRQIRLAVKELNQEAAKLVGKGKYEASGQLIETAKRMGELAADVEALRVRWGSVKPTKRTNASGEKTPLWEYYALVARALGELGGQATRDQLVEWFSRIAAERLKSGDLECNVQGKPYWQRTLGRIKRPMTHEGYLEKGRGLAWTITRLGRDIGKRPKKSDSQLT